VAGQGRVTVSATAERAQGGALRRFVSVEAGEWRATLLSAAFFFCVLCGYFILRPLREEIGVQLGKNALPWLYSGSLTGTLLINPLLGALVSRLPIRRYLAVVYRAFALSLVACFFLWTSLGGVQGPNATWLAPAFFIWISVFNLVITTVFWAFMADTFRVDQGKRLFGFIGAGGTIGAIVGAALTSVLAKPLGATMLLLITAALFEVAVQLMRRVPGTFRTTESSASREDTESAVGGSAIAGVSHILKSPYLLGICAYMFLMTLGNTVLYSQQTEIIGQAISDRTERTVFLARMDFAVQAITLLCQFFLTGQVIRRVGIGVALAIIPLLTAFGFGALAMSPVLATFVVFHVTRRGGLNGISGPAREVLYTVVSREDKYKSKSVIDTFVYRGGDQLAAWTYAGLGMLGLGLSTIAWLAVPIGLMWLVVGLWLGREHGGKMTSRVAPATN
jgi:ATP:ADP antiporter, AAA family